LLAIVACETRQPIAARARLACAFAGRAQCPAALAAPPADRRVDLLEAADRDRLLDRAAGPAHARAAPPPRPPPPRHPRGRGEQPDRREQQAHRAAPRRVRPGGDPAGTGPWCRRRRAARSERAAPLATEPCPRAPCRAPSPRRACPRRRGYGRRPGGSPVP